MQNLNQLELAERWRLSPRTLERWRLKGKGPQFLKLGGRCVYPVVAVEAFETACLCGVPGWRVGNKQRDAA